MLSVNNERRHDRPRSRSSTASSRGGRPRGVERHLPVGQPRLHEAVRAEDEDGAARRAAAGRQRPTCSSRRSRSRPRREAEPVRGLLTAGGLSPQEYDRERELEVLRRHLQAARPARWPRRDSRSIKSADGKNIVDTYGTINDACQLAPMFHDIGDEGRPVPQQRQLDEHRQHLRERSPTAARVPTRRCTRASTRPTTTGGSRHTTRRSATGQLEGRSRRSQNITELARPPGSTRRHVGTTAARGRRRRPSGASSTRAPDGELVDRAVDEVADEEHAFVEPHDDRAVGRAVGERGQGRRVHDGERPHLARAAHRVPRRARSRRSCAHTGRGGWRNVPHAAQRWMRSSPSRSAAQNAASSSFPGRVGTARASAPGRSGPLAALAHRSTPSSTAPDGSLIAPHTNATSAPAT